MRNPRFYLETKGEYGSRTQRGYRWGAPRVRTYTYVYVWTRAYAWENK